MKSKKGIVPIVIGALFIVSAAVLTLYNIHENNTAQEKSEELVLQLENRITQGTDATDESEEEQEERETETPYYVLEPEVEMPTQNISGEDYIGVVSIPSYGLKLPIVSQYSEYALKNAPCRYWGSAYTNDLVIAGHNYRAHFGSISNLQSGDEVVFTDVDGNVFVYEVVQTEVLPGNAIDEMTSGEWDLTLFTCNYSGAQRVTVRCDLK